MASNTENDVNPLEIEKVVVKTEIQVEVKNEIDIEIEEFNGLATQNHLRIKQEAPSDHEESIQEHVPKIFTMTAGPSPKPTMKWLRHMRKPSNDKQLSIGPKIVGVQSLADRKVPVRVVGAQPKAKTKKEAKAKPKIEPRKFETEHITDKELSVYLDSLKMKRNYKGGTWKCEDCVLVFHCAENLEKHMKLHRPNRGPHACPICKQRFAKLKELRDHNKKHYKLYKCNECAYKIHLVKRIRVHWLQKHAAEKMYCKKCNVKFLSRNEMLEHNATVHMGGIYECDMCGRRYKTKCSLGQHIKYRHNAEEISKVECKICHKLYFDKYIQYHIKYVHGPENEENTYCFDCKIKFKTVMGYKKHLRASLRHISPENLSFRRNNTKPIPKVECKYCHKLYFNTYIQVHMKVVHGQDDGENTYCVDCDAKFKSERGYKKHLKTSQQHVQLENLRFECDHCKKRFVSKSLVGLHIEEAHLRIRRYPCESPGCEWRSCSQRAYRKHFSKHHADKSNAKRHVCAVCGKEFASNFSLKEHTNYHTGERPYKCDTCDAAFMYSAALSTHKKLVHLKLKRPYDLKLAERRKGVKTEDKDG